MFSIKNIFKKKGSITPPEGRIEFFKKKFKKAQQQKLIEQSRKHKIKNYLEKAGLEVSPKKLSKTFFNIAVFINLAVSAYLIYYFSVTYGITWATVAASMIVLWVFIFVILIFVLWILFYIAVDLKIYKRNIELEEVLPDFLQLAASNINAGMTIDRALWYAVRPRFGVLAKEIEIIAKETMGGADLRNALEEFAARYDSMILKRAISMINEGVNAGGEIGDLLNRIAIDIQQQRSMLKEMSANVTTYVIFITFATLVAGPFLFAMSGVLIAIVQNLSSSLGTTKSVAFTSGIPLTFSGTGVSISDFRTFAIVSLITTSLFSAMMVSTIKKGNVKSGAKYIPIFIVVSLTIYFVIFGLTGRLIGVFF